MEVKYASPPTQSCFSYFQLLSGHHFQFLRHPRHVTYMQLAQESVSVSMTTSEKLPSCI